MPKGGAKEAGMKESNVSLSSADVLHSNDVDAANKRHNAVASTEGSADVKEADAKEVDGEVGDNFESLPTGKRQSTRVVRSFGSVYLEGAVRGLAASVNALELGTGDDASSEGGKLEDGLVITHGGRTFGKIANYLGKGAMGFVYKFEYIPAHGGDAIQCALKTVRSTKTVQEQVKLEKALVSEVAIAFACARAVGFASVIGAIIPEPGTSEGGLMLICVFVDGGDLEEAMHSGAKKNGRLVEDYHGLLYKDESTKVWPIISIMLQIFQVFDHIHGRGTIHQDFKPANLMLQKDGIVKVADFGLAAFSCKKSKDPWNLEKELDDKGQLCAKMMGGAPEYFCPE